MKKWLCVLLLICLLVPGASAAQTKYAFEVEKLTVQTGDPAALKIVASDVSGENRTVHVKDDQGEKYQVTIPAGSDCGWLDVSTKLSSTGHTRTYTIVKNDAYGRGKPYSCAVTSRASTVYSFNAAVFQTTEGNELIVRLTIAKPERLAKGTKIEIRDDSGNVLHTASHSQSRTSMKVTWKTDHAWVPGKNISVWVNGRSAADDTALLAVRDAKNYKVLYGVKRTDNKLAYTMDCGSHSTYLPQILDILDEYGLKITFFVTGQFAKNNPDLVREIARRGHEIGNHSWSHPNFNDLKDEDVLKELKKTSDLIESLTGVRPTYFRPPEGAGKPRVISIVRAAGYEVIRWTHDCCDARKEASEKNSLKLSTKNVSGGSIILAHIDAKCTVAVLRDIFNWYRDNGYQVVKVSELLHQGNVGIDENGMQYPM